MKKFIVCQSEYMHEGPCMYSIKAASLRDLLLGLLDYNDDGETLEELTREFNESNGDGMAYQTVFDVEEDKAVLGVDS